MRRIASMISTTSAEFRANDAHNRKLAREFREKQEAARHQVDWRWVRGHNGHEGNEAADQLANQAIDEMLRRKTG